MGQLSLRAALVDRIRRIPIGEKAWTDARGWVLDPLLLAGLEGAPLGNLHVASMRPGAVRGNHAHGAAEEWLLFCGGPASLIAGPEEICIGGGEPELFAIPAGLPHAIVNRSDKEIFLVVFYAEKELQTAPAKVL
ncbi:MAG: cupin domain-containing protein [Syntrophaceae bacterium]|nr:cupin domain-containing protein [Syntrophaceae bacterium]